MASPENNIVREWLRTLDLAHHLDNFLDNGYDDLETCKQIGEEDMDAIGVRDLRQREDLRQAVARLRQEGGTAVYFTLMGPESDYLYEEDVTVDYGYAEDEDEKIHPMLNGGGGGVGVGVGMGMCDCQNCECLHEDPFAGRPQCYLDRQRWQWTEHHLRRGSYEGATEYRRMMSEHPGEPPLVVNKARSASAVERGGFIEAVGGMSPHEQKKRMFRSLKETGRSQHSGSSLTSTCSESSSGPTSPDHAMCTGAEEGVAGGESADMRKGRPRGLKNFFKKLITSPGEQSRAEGPTHKTAHGLEAGWKAGESVLSQQDILDTLQMFKNEELTQEQAWAKVLEKEEEGKLRKARSLSPTVTQLSPGVGNPQRLQTHSDEVSPLTPSDTDSARGTEGPTGSDGSPQSLNKVFNPSCQDVVIASPHPMVDVPMRVGPAEALPAVPGPPDDGEEEGGLTFQNSHAMLASPDEERPPLAKAVKTASLSLELPASGADSGGTVCTATSGSADREDYLEPNKRLPKEYGNKKRNRSKSSPALNVGHLASYSSLLRKAKDPKGGKSITERIRQLGRPVSKQSGQSPSTPDEISEQRFSEVSDGSPDRDGTISSCTSNSSKSSGDVENKRPSYEPDPQLFNSIGEYIGEYLDIAIANKNVSPNPHDVDTMPLEVGNIIYVTKKHGGYWDGICGRRQGKFKFIDVDMLSPEELKDRLQPEYTEDEGDIDVPMSEVTAKYVDLKELLQVIQCEQYLSILHLHDFGRLEKFQDLEEQHLLAWDITDRTHIAQLTTAARMLRDKRTGKGTGASQQLSRLLSTRTPRGRTVRDSGFYASTDLNRTSEASDLLMEECEESYQDEEGGVASSSDETQQENSNVNNSNCVGAAVVAHPVNRGGKAAGGGPCRHGAGSKPGFGHNGQLAGSPCCPRKDGNGSQSPMVHQACRVHTNGTGPACIQQQQQPACNSGWGSPTPYRDSPLFKHRHLMATFSDPGCGPRLQPGQKPAHRCPVQTGRSLDHQCPSPEVMPKGVGDSGDLGRWRRGALSEMYGTQDPGCYRSGSGTFMQSALSKTHPSPKLPRRFLQQYHCQPLQSGALPPPIAAAAAPASQPRGRRKSRSVSPHHHRHHVPHHHRHQQQQHPQHQHLQQHQPQQHQPPLQQHQHQPPLQQHQQQHDMLPAQNSVHANPTLPLRSSKSPRQPASAQLEWHIERTLHQEGIDLKEEPYSNKMGFCGIPPALVQRYAEELEADMAEVAVCLESLRVKELVDACRCWFRSDALASQSSKLVYAGTGKTVEDWLTSLGLPMYVQSLTLNGWDELDIVIHMDKDDLRKCGIDRPGHLRRLSNALEHLKMSSKPF